MSSITRREFIRISTTFIGGALLAACGVKAISKAVSPTKAQQAREKLAEVSKTMEVQEIKLDPQKPNWPLGEVPRERTLIYQYITPMNGNCNPFDPGYFHQTGNAILYEPCAFYGVHADKEYLWLAESYQYSADAQVCTIKFRNGIKWSDGTPFRAADVAWSMETLKRVDGLNRQSVYKKELVRAEAIDDTTLKVTLNQPDWRFFFNSLTFRFDLGDYGAVQAPQMFAGVADADLASFNVYDQAKGWPISTGPYGAGTSNEQYTHYDLRDSWWAVDTGFLEDYPGPWRIIHQASTNSTMSAQMLINKEIDQTYVDMHPFVVTSILEQGEHLTTWTGRKSPYGYIDWWPISVQFCTQKPPFDNPKVRWAVAYAIDQQKVLDVALGGAGTVAMSPFPNYPKLATLLDDIKDIIDQYNVLEYNLDKSAALMAEAGFTKDSEGFWVDAEGKRPDSDLYAAVPLFDDIAPIVAEQLRQGGFFSQHKAPSDVWEAIWEGRAPMFLFGHAGATIDPYDTFMLYYTSPQPMGQQEWNNVTRWQKDEFKAIADEMNKAPMDSITIKELFQRGMKIWYEYLPDCPLVQWYSRIPVNTWYWGNWPNETNPYMTSALWHTTMLYVVLGLKEIQPVLIPFRGSSGNWESPNTYRMIRFEGVNDDCIPNLRPISKDYANDLKDRQTQPDSLRLLSIANDILFLDQQGNLLTNIGKSGKSVQVFLSYEPELKLDLSPNVLIPVHTDEENKTWRPFEKFSVIEASNCIEITVDNWDDKSCGYGTNT